MKKLISVLALLVLATPGFCAHAASDPYKTAKKTAEDTYKMDKKSCSAVKGKERKDCMRIADQKHRDALLEAKTLKAK